jgi:hypothetical protein
MNLTMKKLMIGLIAKNSKSFSTTHLSGQKYQFGLNPEKYLVSECGYLITTGKRGKRQ